ncbi:MAG: MerR family DNA-binding transcriptional regulator, partial [Planktothrix sp.]
MAYIPLRKAVEFLGLHPNTLRKYADEGKIKSIKNSAGQRLYDVES